MIGQAIYFKTPGMKRARKGTVINGNAMNGWRIECKRLQHQTIGHHDIITVPAHFIWLEEDHKAINAPSGIRTGKSISAAELNRRATVAAARFAMTELQVLQARAILEVRRRILAQLAHRNRIPATVEDFDYSEMSSEYQFATLKAYRTAVTNATPDHLIEFKRHLDGDSDRSRIAGNMERCGKTAVIRYLKRRQEYHQSHRDIDDYVNVLAA